jgi:CDP-glycerol glycerophosphotransferase (TagB/SpsB family)
MNGKQKWAYDQYLINYCWKVFYPNESYKKTASKLAKNKGENIYVSGYTLSDDFKKNELNDFDPWKLKNKNIKRIIWAPHHSIDKITVDNSSFLENHDFFIEIANKYKNFIQIAFKPHPLLKSKLYEHNDWGKEKTDEYYSSWNSNDNSFFSDGEYINLFIKSDALIHDCGSFMIEYLYTKNPVIYISRQDTTYLSDFGKKAFNMHYKGSSNSEIENFIKNVVMENDDPMKNKRHEFYTKYLEVNNGVMVSTKIWDYINLNINNI